MDLLQLLVLLVIAGICGSIAELIVGFSPGGFLVSIVVGVIGAYLGTILGTALSNRFGLPAFAIEIGDQRFDLVWATIGSILLLLIISLVRGGRGRRVVRRRR